MYDFLHAAREILPNLVISIIEYFLHCDGGAFTALTNLDFVNDIAFKKILDAQLHQLRHQDTEVLDVY